MYDDLSYLELNALQARVAHAIRDRRVKGVLKALAAKRSASEQISKKVPLFEGLLARELRIGREVLIDEYLDMLELLLDIEQE